MKTILNPSKSSWKQLAKRPVYSKNSLDRTVAQILAKVRDQGDDALFDYSRKLEGVNITALQVSDSALKSAEAMVDDSLKKAIKLAFKNIEKFHASQQVPLVKIETSPGVSCWQQNVPIEKVGLYIPGGSAPLFSTVLMLGIPAMLAGCEEVVLCTPPNPDGSVNPAILFAAQLAGINKIFRVGGAQAIAAMAFGTESIPAVYKIFGPGNQYVTRAKEMVMEAGIAIDMPAGPSELLVIADESCEPAFVAADLLSQAEHGPDSQVILLVNEQQLATKVLLEIDKQVVNLPRKAIAQQALNNSRCLVMNALDDCIAFSNMYAPEHLTLVTGQNKKLLRLLKNAGSVFLGNYSCESAGDYASGTNHTLPTNGYSRSFSGVSLDSFMKKITFQKINRQGIQNIGPAIEQMAEAEMLQAHKNAVSIRLKTLTDG